MRCFPQKFLLLSFKTKKRINCCLKLAQESLEAWIHIAPAHTLLHIVYSIDSFQNWGILHWNYISFLFFSQISLLIWRRPQAETSHLVNMIGDIKLHGCDILACIILNFSMSLLMLEYVWMALNNNLYRMQGNNFSRLCFVLMIWYCFFFLRLYDNKLFYFQFVLFAIHFNGTKLIKQCLEGGSWTCIATPIPRLSRIPFSFSMPHPVPFLSRNLGFSQKLTLTVFPSNPGSQEYSGLSLIPLPQPSLWQVLERMG